MASTEPLPRVALLALGGTIATPLGRNGRAEGVRLTADSLVAAVPELSGVAALTATTFRSVMSSALTLQDVVELGSAVAAARHDGTAVVVTMGTDSLEEVAYALDLLLPVGPPVVVTGAMRNAGSVGSDGPANVLDAVRIAASPVARDAGVLVALHGEIHSARRVRKTHATSLSAFSSPDGGPIGAVSEGRVRIRTRLAAQPEPIIVDRPVPAVALLRLSIGDDGRLIAALAGHGYAGAVVEVFGAGHVAGSLMPAISALVDRMSVVSASRTGAGELYRSVGTFPGSERDLLEKGVVSAGDLDGLKARVLLSLLLGSATDWRDGFRRRLG